jgi:hypothetical protein
MKKAGDLVQGFFDTYGIRDDKNYAGFMAAWTDIIGEKLATHSRPSDIKGQVLIVSVDHPGWMTHIRMAERETVRRIQMRFPQLHVVSLAFLLVDALPPPGGVRKAMAEAQKTVPAVPGQDTENVPENDNGESGKPDMDKTVLFSALDRLKAAMQKHDAG